MKNSIFLFVFVFFIQFSPKAQSYNSIIIGKWRYDSTITNNIKVKNAGNPQKDYFEFSNDSLTIFQSHGKIWGKYVFTQNEIKFQPFNSEDGKEYIFKIITLNEKVLVLTDEGKSELSLLSKLYLSRR